MEGEWDGKRERKRGRERVRKRKTATEEGGGAREGREDALSGRERGIRQDIVRIKEKK